MPSIKKVMEKRTAEARKWTEHRYTPGHPDRMWSGLYEIRFKGEVIGRTRNQVRACHLARSLGAGAFMEEVRDGEWKPFGCALIVSEQHAREWAAHCPPKTPEEVRAELAQLDQEQAA